MLFSFKMRNLLHFCHTDFVFQLRIQSCCQNDVSVFVKMSEKVISFFVFFVFLLEVKL